MAEKKEKVKAEEAAACTDKKCPFHGDVKVRGMAIIATVVSDKPKKTVIVERPYLRYIPKFERYERRTTRISAHNPDCVKARAGDRVRVAECRKLSKTKSWVVTEKLDQSVTVGTKG